MTGKGVLFLLFTLCLLNGCGPKPEAEPLVTVNNYAITREEFESEFKASAFGEVDTSQSRQDFLNTLIDRKLILQYAQKEGIDKEKNFLKTIEKFWEQSLLKVALDKKTREIDSEITASDWQAKRTEEAKIMSAWMNELRQKANININDSVLKSIAADKQDGSR